MCARMRLEKNKGYRKADAIVVKSKDFVVRWPHVGVPSGSPTCVTLGMLLNLWTPQFPSQLKEAKNRTHFGMLP